MSDTRTLKDVEVKTVYDKGKRKVLVNGTLAVLAMISTPFFLFKKTAPPKAASQIEQPRIAYYAAPVDHAKILWGLVSNDINMSVARGQIVRQAGLSHGELRKLLDALRDNSEFLVHPLFDKGEAQLSNIQLSPSKKAEILFKKQNNLVSFDMTVTQNGRGTARAHHDYVMGKKVMSALDAIP